MRVLSSPGGFRFLPSDNPFSNGVAAEPGHSIVRVRMPRHTPLEEGYGVVEEVLRNASRPLAAVCAMELRIPEPMTRDGFTRFNRPYVAQYERWGLLIEGHVPAARTNIAPEVDPPAGPALHAFCFTTAHESPRKTFVLSGVPERAGLAGGLPACWDDIVQTMERHMAALGVAWSEATETQFYGLRADHGLFAARLERFDELAVPGLRWFFSRPPIDDLRLEIDVRALAHESWR